MHRLFEGEGKTGQVSGGGKPIEDREDLEVPFEHGVDLGAVDHGPALRAIPHLLLGEGGAKDDRHQLSMTRRGDQGVWWWCGEAEERCQAGIFSTPNSLGVFAPFRGWQVIGSYG